MTASRVHCIACGRAGLDADAFCGGCGCSLAPGAVPPRRMGRWVVPAAAGIVAVGGGLLIWWFLSRAGPGKTPEATFESIRKNFLKEDWRALYAMFSPKGRKALEERWASAKELVKADPQLKVRMKLPDNYESMNSEDAFIHSIKTSENIPLLKAQLKGATIVSVDIDGDKATVKWKAGDGEKSTYRMSRVDGLWYLEF